MKSIISTFEEVGGHMKDSKMVKDWQIAQRSISSQITYESKTSWEEEPLWKYERADTVLHALQDSWTHINQMERNTIWTDIILKHLYGLKGLFHWFTEKGFEFYN